MPRVPLLLALAALAAATPARAAGPLHERIDAAVNSASGGGGGGRAAAAAIADDAEFLRRVYLDLAGTIPSAAEARAFLADPSGRKRAELVDALLADERFPRRMAEALTVMLMERRVAPNKPEAELFEGYLRRTIAAGLPLDRIVAGILAPDPDDAPSRGAAVFWTKRLENVGQNPVDLPGLTRDVGRLFLGIDLKCAQCHNHLTVREYKQSDYQGLFAFVGHTYIRKDLPFPAVGEKLVDRKVEFASVFSGEKREIGPRVPGLSEVEVPRFEKGQEWVAPPDKKKQFDGVPKFSPLKVLADRLPRAENERFRLNLANRLWYLMLGRGVVHPLDLHHKDNPPSNPELLGLLADELVAAKFDLTAFVRGVALSKTYQRSSRLSDDDPGKVVPPGSFRVAQLKRVSPEQLLRAALTATGELDGVLAREDEPARPKPAASTDSDADAEGEGAKPRPRSDEPPTYRELRKRFVAAFAAPAGEPEVEFSPTVASALFVMNEDTILGWLRPRDGNLVDRLSKTNDAGKLADELYLSVLTRYPTDEERADVSAHLAARSAANQERPAAVAELAWALLASTEFAVNH